MYSTKSNGQSPTGLDIGIHPVGTWIETPPETFCKTFKAKGYKLIKDSMISAELPDVKYLATRTPAGRQIMVCAKQDAPMSIIYGYGQKLGKTNIPIALFRRKTNQAAMAWCIATNGEKIRVQARHADGCR